MQPLNAIRSVTYSLNTEDMLRYLIKERFPGKTVVTASLRSSSIVVLDMISKIDRATPIVFCRPGTHFPESKAYQDEIVQRMGLTNISISVGREAKPHDNDCSHCERMWVEYENCPGQTFEMVHLNDTLAPYQCWISAVNQMRRPSHVRHRVDVEGQLIRVDPLTRWTPEEIRAYMKEHKIPYHKRAYRKREHPEIDENFEPPLTFAF